MINTEEWKRKIMEGLKEVYDPEIPINIVDLGLIYDLKITDDGKVYIRVGATTPSCPVTEDIAYTVEQVIKETVNAKEIQVDLDLDTRWTPLMMTEEGRKEFKRKYGYDIVEYWLSQYGDQQVSTAQDQ
ncbi:MAG: metal-sulfur cluster assembly factor [Sulfolobaceae archaeon]|nr:metal-sulfur cluster assembly factor [Sulfolobaceae archaeon]